MAIKIWVHCAEENQKKSAHEVAEHLTQQGIEVQDFGAYLSPGPGVLISRKATPAVCEQLRDLSHNGRIQVLACCVEDIPGDAAWQLMEAGASDVLVRADCNELVHEIASRFHRWEVLEYLVNDPIVQDAMVCESQALKGILRQVVEVAHFTDASVLILGESGTGKELLANLVHALDSRSNKGNLVILDCSTIMPELSGSEFFGHERGAFTGALSSRDGVFALADGGTLFLDEVGELPLVLQTQLLRVIQEHTFKRAVSYDRVTRLLAECEHTSRDWFDGARQ